MEQIDFTTWENEDFVVAFRARGLRMLNDNVKAYTADKAKNLYGDLSLEVGDVVMALIDSMEKANPLLDTDRLLKAVSSRLQSEKKPVYRAPTGKTRS